MTTLEDLARAIERIAELERRISELEAQNQRPTDDDLLTVREASAIAKMDPKTINARITSGKLPAFEPEGSRGYRVRRGDLMAWLQRRVQPKQGDASVEDEAARILGAIPLRRSSR